MKILFVLLLTIAPLCAQRSTLTPLNPTSNGTNFNVDLNNAHQYVRLTNNFFLLQTTNRTSGVYKQTILLLDAGTTNWTLSFGANYRFPSFTNNPPTTINSNTVGMLILRSFGTNETNIIAFYN